MILIFAQINFNNCKQWNYWKTHTSYWQYQYQYHSSKTHLWSNHKTSYHYILIWTCLFTCVCVLVWILYARIGVYVFLCVRMLLHWFVCLCACQRVLIGVCWLASICMPAGDTSAKSLHQWHTHLGDGGWWGTGGGQSVKERQVCVCVRVC